MVPRYREQAHAEKSLWLLMAALSYFSQTASPQNTNSPSYTVSFPHYVHRSQVTSLCRMDFKNFEFRVFANDGRVDIVAKLKRGNFQKHENFGHDEVGLESVHCYEENKDEPAKSIALLHWWSTGASFSGYGIVQVFGLVDGHPTVIQQIYYSRKALGSGAAFNPRTRVLTVKASHYAAEDGHCCPSKMDILTFQMADGQFSKVRQKTVPIRNNSDAGSTVQTRP